MSDEEFPQSDKLDGAPHPRATSDLFGHETAEAEFLDLHASGRLHHAWLLSGPRGIGKATLAWRIARFLMADTGDGAVDMFGDPALTSLQMSPDDPVFHRVAALSEPGIALCRRSYDQKAKRLKSALTVEEVRNLKGFFNFSAAEGGWRVAIIDAADEMNTAAANALLKLLEEPPARTVLLLVCHRPARLLPTIRSRCRTLRLSSLSPENLTKALVTAGIDAPDDPLLPILAGGSVGEAIRLIDGNGTDLYRDILRLMAEAPRMDRNIILALGEKAAKRGAEADYDLILRLTSLAIGRMARAGATGEALAEAEAPLHRLCPDTQAAQNWAACLQDIEGRTAHAKAVNLDPAQVILDMFLRIEKTAGKTALVSG